MTIGQIPKMLSPNPFALVTSLKEDGDTNIMALSWWMFVSNDPATVAIATSKKGYTGRCIERTGEFGVCFASRALREQAFACGTRSGRDTDKAGLFNIPLIAAKTIKPRLVDGCRVALECMLEQTVEAGDHTVYIARIVAMHADESIPSALYAWDGYRRLDVVL